MITKKYEANVWTTKIDLLPHGSPFYLDLECDKSNLTDVIKEAEKYIEEVVPYALDIIEIQTDEETGIEISDDTILAWQKDPIEKVKWDFKGITEEKLNEMMEEQQEGSKEQVEQEDQEDEFDLYTVEGKRRFEAKYLGANNIYSETEDETEDEDER